MRSPDLIKAAVVGLAILSGEHLNSREARAQNVVCESYADLPSAIRSNVSPSIIRVVERRQSYGEDIYQFAQESARNGSTDSVKASLIVLGPSVQEASQVHLLTTSWQNEADRKLQDSLLKSDIDRVRAEQEAACLLSYASQVQTFAKSEKSE